MKCLVCGDEWPDADGGLEAANDHLRVMHPNEYGDGPERWPDGSIVLHDETLEPGDFTDGGAA